MLTDITDIKEPFFENRSIKKFYDLIERRDQEGMLQFLTNFFRYVDFENGDNRDLIFIVDAIAADLMASSLKGENSLLPDLLGRIFLDPMIRDDKKKIFKDHLARKDISFLSPRMPGGGVLEGPYASPAVSSTVQVRKRSCCTIL